MQVETLPKNCQFNLPNRSYNEFETELDRAIVRIVETEGFKECEIDKKCVSTNGGNYLGELYEIDVKGKTNDGVKELNIFVKNIIQMECLKIVSINDVFNTEMFAYKELSKIFNELQEKANIPVDDQFKMVKIYDETNSEAIIMENVNRKGFTTTYRMDVMTLEFAEVAMKQLAKFHALSFVLKEKRPQYFINKIKSLKYGFIFNDDWANLVRSAKETLLKHTDVKYKDKIEKLFEDVVNRFKNLVYDESIKLCLCHGDYRANNLMVKMNGNEIQELIPVDYQLIHYGCPVFDLLFFLFMGTDREFRKNHMEYIKNLYYETFANFLEYFEMNADSVYSREQFETLFKERFDYGLMIGLFFLPFVLASECDGIDLTKEMTDTCFNVDGRYKERLEGVFDEYIELGFM